MGNNYILHNSDCIETMKQLESNSIDLILTDMPYIISKTNGFSKGGSWNNPSSGNKRKTPPRTDFGDWDKKPLDLNTLMKEFKRILKKNGTLIMFYDIYKMQELKEIAELYKFKQPRLCIWQKTNPVPLNSKLNYLSNSREYFISFVKDSKPTFNSEYDTGLYTYSICAGKERTEHPTQKPLTLMKDLIIKHSNENDLILDCFAGSGSTGVAAVELNRKFIGIEIDYKFYEIMEQRLLETER